MVVLYSVNTMVLSGRRMLFENSLGPDKQPSKLVQVSLGQNKPTCYCPGIFLFMGVIDTVCLKAFLPVFVSVRETNPL